MKFIIKTILLLVFGTIAFLPVTIYKLGHLVAIEVKSMVKGKNKFQKLMEWVADFLSGNWMLEIFPNGGTAVILRTLFTGTIFCIIAYVLYVLTHKFNDINNVATFVVKMRVMFIEVLKTNIGKCAGVYAAVYVTLYSRFVSQWTYIANLYNQIKQVEISTCYQCKDSLNCKQNENKTCVNNECNHRIAELKAGFIEDAITLHMYKKKLFATVIYQWITQSDIQYEYIEHHSDTLFKGKDITKKQVKSIIESLGKILGK